MNKSNDPHKPKPQQAVFHLYRYQIIPTSQDIQLRLDSDIKSIESLKAQKNRIFEDALKSIKSVSYSRTELTHKVTEIGNNIFLLKLAAKRSLKVSTRDFSEQTIANWPAMSIIINNDPAVQKAIVQFNRKTFADTSSVTDILQDNLNNYLKEYQLHVIFESIFEETKFWEIVSKYQNRIIQAEFDLVSPNMANISKGLNIDLQQLHTSTNTQKTKLQLNSDKESVLTLSKEDPTISGIVDYASQGGGNISLKIRGYYKKIKTSEKVTEITIDELSLSSKNGQEILDRLGGYLK